MKIVFVGLISTGFMDFGAAVGRKLGLHKAGGYAVLGAWFKGLLGGKIINTQVLSRPKDLSDAVLGVIGHYLIGIVLTLIYVSVMKLVSWPAADILWATIYGIFTSVLPWFILFPALGLGFFASKGPRDAHLLRSSFLNHFYFGLALGVSLKYLV